MPQKCILSPNRGRGKRISEEERWKIIHTYRSCQSICGTAEQCLCGRASVRRWVNHFEKRGNVQEAARSGRAPVITPVVAQQALDILLSAPKPTTTELATELHNRGLIPKIVSKKTVSRHVHRAARARGDVLVAYRGKVKKGLTAATKAKRLKFAKDYLNFNWDRVMFTDRKRFYLRFPGSMVKGVDWCLRSKKDERQGVFQPSKPNCMNVYSGITPKGGIHAVEVAGTTGIKLNYFTKKGTKAKNITTQQYLDVVTDFCHEGHLRFKEGEWYLQQDNDPTHKVAQTVINSYNGEHHTDIKLIKDWPPCSPDLNIIENMWSFVQQKVNKMGCTTFKSFKTCIRKLLLSESAELVEYLGKLYASMPKRLAKVIELDGGKTDF